MHLKGKQLINRSKAIDFLGIDPKHFDNYFKNSSEFKGEKIRGRWYFDKSELQEWINLKNERTVYLSIEDYKKCFEFAIKMVYGGLSLNGIRGQRSEVQAADDVILGILAEHAIQKFLESKFNTVIELDEEVHTEQITPQDFVKINVNGLLRAPKIGVGVKASKLKSAFLVLGSNEVELPDRKSDVYIFARVDLPSDHLFRLLREHSFFKKATRYLEDDKRSKKIGELKQIPVWICGITYINELEKVKEIPGQKFDNGYRYVKSVAKMHNLKKDWIELIKKL